MMCDADADDETAMPLDARRSLSSVSFDLLAPYTERYTALLINPVASSTTSCSASSATHEERQSMTARALA